MAPPLRQWPVCRNRWAGLLCALTGRQAAATRVLSLAESGLWRLSSPEGHVCLRLVHVWPSFAWLTLRFQHSPLGPDRPPLELTVWKPGLPDATWRALRLCVEGQVAVPHHVVTKEQA